MNAIIPIPKIPISIRPGTMDDLAFIDSLQKKHTKQVGWFPTKTMEGKIKAGHVLIAEEGASNQGQGASADGCSPLSPRPLPLGYLIGNDQYFKRDDVGIIYQINIAEGKRRGLVGAMLLKAQFERSAWGCKLYCCWCAQDIEANRFWEAMGFVPLAFRTGSRAKDRVHIFWQKRIRAGDVATPWWFPAQTTGGSIREDRLVFPIPPNKTWADEMPRILPQQEQAIQPRLPGRRAKAKPQTPTLQKPTSMRKQFAPVWAEPIPEPAPEPVAPEPKPKRQKAKNNPMHIAAARELRDRWLERVNDDPSLLESQAKYELSRQLTHIGRSPARCSPRLELIEHR